MGESASGGVSYGSGLSAYGESGEGSESGWNTGGPGEGGSGTQAGDSSGESGSGETTVGAEGEGSSTGGLGSSSGGEDSGMGGEGSTGAADDTTGGKESADGGGEESAGEGSTGEPSEEEDTCSTVQSCPGATDIGEVSGDASSDPLNVQGTTNAWYEVRVTEDVDGDGDFLGYPLSVNVRLSSPPGGENFDLYVYLAESFSASACGANFQASIKVGEVDSVDLLWGETDLLANGSDDDRWVAIEVVSTGLACQPDESWTLVVQGNTG